MSTKPADITDPANLQSHERGTGPIRKKGGSQLAPPPTTCCVVAN